MLDCPTSNQNMFQVHDAKRKQQENMFYFMAPL